MNDPRGPGRPPLTVGEKSERVHCRMPVALLDDLCLVAIRTRRPLSQVIREAIGRLVDAEKADGVLSQENRNSAAPAAS